MFTFVIWVLGLAILTSMAAFNIWIIAVAFNLHRALGIPRAAVSSVVWPILLA